MDFTHLNSGSSAAPLNLSKGSVLDLTKQAPALKNCILGGGWDMAVAGPTADLDLAAFLVEENGRVAQVPNDVIFFNNMSAAGIRLEGDNRILMQLNLELRKLSSSLLFLMQSLNVRLLA